MPPSRGATAESDPALLAFVPAAGNGLDFRYDAETTAQVAADPGLARDASGLAVGLYTVVGQTPPVDFAIVSVTHLRDKSASDTWFRAFRDSYDAAACAQAGGVTGHAESAIAGHAVFIGSCAGGAFTYHVRLPRGDLVVSITAVGPDRLGERIIQGLP